MFGRIPVAGLASLGLIGGVGSVVYNEQGDATVRIKNEKTGHVQELHLAGGSGTTYSCPDGTQEKVEPHDIELGRIKLTLMQLRHQERAIEARYPGNVAPPSVVDRYEALGRRDDRLVDAYNSKVDARNAIIDSDCSAG